MKAQFIRLNSIEETEDGSVVINASNISSIRRINYNDVVQTMVLMIGGEKFGVTDTPEEIVAMVEDHAAVLNHN